MTLNVGTLTGRTFQVECFPGDTVGDVKGRIFEETGIAVESQILVWRERALADDMGTLGGYGVGDGSTLQLVLHMAGGPGPPLKLKKSTTKEEEVVLLLCKQNEDLYMLELRMREGESHQNAARQLYRLTSGRRRTSSLFRQFENQMEEGGFEGRLPLEVVPVVMVPRTKPVEDEEKEEVMVEDVEMGRVEGRELEESEVREEGASLKGMASDERLVGGEEWRV
ncbi:AN1-type zinc finger protein 4 [Rhizophlyctis rosea]|uniref:AN1-type zinc finger protein 4 n=1 Tax=Rhizophlyctis rosea TaxID=64517 RepID=A0AAD5S9G3_9FUNG|nr:AN1-type zinc finger protein 4 [Rhizophlyctis rosea]